MTADTVDACTTCRRGAGRSSRELAVRLAEAARRVRACVTADILDTTKERQALAGLLEALRACLVRDIEASEFADMCAQTIVCGLFSARLGNPNLTAANAISPEHTNPFFSGLMEAFLSIDSRAASKSDARAVALREITALFEGADFEAMVRELRSGRAMEDPVMHFYEMFLHAYDPHARVKRGVFYTPHPIVQYLVRSVDHILQKEFKLEDGLADTSTWADVSTRISGLEVPDGIDPNEPFVQILDPATGTGTFLAEAIECIYRRMLGKWKAQGLDEKRITEAWNEYVPTHLLPRLHGFELLIAPYAIAHLKLGFKLRETGYTFASGDRLRVFLANALEPPAGRPFTRNAYHLFAAEAGTTDELKSSHRFTVIIGNPPYAGISSNMTGAAQRLVDAYKQIDGVSLRERKLWLQDDYVKFLRYAQMLIDAAGSGVLGFVTNHGYLGNPTFRGMRKSLMNTFSHIRVIDLHGNANRKERAPDGSKDKNVFDIRQGVAVCLAAAKKGAERVVEHKDLWGTREDKYRWLSSGERADSGVTKIAPVHPDYFFVPRDTDTASEYAHGWSITKVVQVSSAGFITARDRFVLDFDAALLMERIAEFADPQLADEEIRVKYFTGRGSGKYPHGDTRGWKLPLARQQVREDEHWRDRVLKCLYRPFDYRYVYWADSMVDWPRKEVMGHMRRGDNWAILTARSNKSSGTDHFFCSKLISETKCAEYSTQSAVFPLYLYEQDPSAIERPERRPNLSSEFLRAFANALQVPRDGPHGLPLGVCAEDIFHYAYAVFHSPEYRRRYAGFLINDFPRLPLPRNICLFRDMAHLGKEIVSLHLMTSSSLNTPVAVYFGASCPRVAAVRWAGGTILLDANREGSVQGGELSGFSGVSKAVWQFRIGGYQVCEKWLKDRRGRTLSVEERAHYTKVITAVSKTINCMKEVDRTIQSHGGWEIQFSKVSAL